MLPELNYNQNVFVEISNLQHGGQGWELGTCIWSPERDKGLSLRWKLMNEIQVGDIIIHLTKVDGAYHLYGISTVSSSLIQVAYQPPSPGKWANMAPYQRINLSNFNRLQTPQYIYDFFNQYERRLRHILEHFNYGQFYYEFGTDNILKVSQRYVAKCPSLLYELLNEYSDEIDFNPIIGANENVPTINEPQNPDYNPPGRIDTIVSRIIRDTRLSRAIKQEYNWQCHICGNTISLPGNNNYAEAHHLQPLGGEHLGPDIRENIIVLCPTHHTEFDYGSIAINPETRLTEHIDINNEFHNNNISYERNDLGDEYLNYHFNNRYNRE